MALTELDHVNLRTGRLADMVRFYTEVLHLHEGPRPRFAMAGAWLYCGEQAAIHLIEVAPGLCGQASQIDHFAFKAVGLQDMIERLRSERVPYRVAIVPDLGLRQLRLRDPDGNLVEIVFAADEQADLSDFDGSTS